jgi:hypothetical protein
VKIAEEEKVRAHSLARNTLGIEGHAGALGRGLGRVTNINSSHGFAQIKQQVG